MAPHTSTHHATATAITKRKRASPKHRLFPPPKTDFPHHHQVKNDKFLQDLLKDAKLSENPAKNANRRVNAWTPEEERIVLYLRQPPKSWQHKEVAALVGRSAESVRVRWCKMRAAADDDNRRRSTAQAQNEDDDDGNGNGEDRPRRAFSARPLRFIQPKPEWMVGSVGAVTFDEWMEMVFQIPS